LREGLETLQAQSFKPDVIYLVLPLKNARTGEAYPDPPPFVAELGVTVVRPAKDYGPLSKLVGALEQEHHKNTIIITVDDDKMYDRDAIRKLVWNSVNNPAVAFGMCGWIKLPWFKPRRITYGYLPWFARGQGRYYDVLQACCGNTYRVGHFAPAAEVIKTPPKDCFTADDMWIAAVLESVGVRRVLLGGRRRSPGGTGYDPINPEWKRKAEASKDSSSIGHSLSSINIRIGKEARCVDQAAELLSTDLSFR